MAYLMHGCICERCHKEFDGYATRGGLNPDFCDKCQKKIDNTKKLAWLKQWRGKLTLKQRIEKIEEWIYDYKNHRHPSVHDIIG
jgi:hypothetical protein